MTPPAHADAPLPNYGIKPPIDADADLKGSFIAIQRAALRARQIAEQTGTDLIVMRDGQVVRMSPRQTSTP